MIQFLIEEAAATALELYEANISAAAHEQAAQGAAGESDVRARHRQLMEQLEG